MTLTYYCLRSATRPRLVMRSNCIACDFCRRPPCTQTPPIRHAIYALNTGNSSDLLLKHSLQECIFSRKEHSVSRPLLNKPADLPHPTSKTASLASALARQPKQAGLSITIQQQARRCLLQPKQPDKLSWRLSYLESGIAAAEYAKAARVVAATAAPTATASPATTMVISAKASQHRAAPAPAATPAPTALRDKAQILHQT